MMIRSTANREHGLAVVPIRIEFWESRLRDDERQKYGSVLLRWDTHQMLPEGSRTPP